MSKNPDDRGGVQGWRQILSEKQDLSRAFESAIEKTVGRPTATDHGPIAEAAFRDWLRGFLPARYGVTSGFIVSSGRTDAEPLRHFDVIIYNQLDAPLLWRERNLDQSELGSRRPVPVEHVLAVLEVKATMTRQTLKDAIDKLCELTPLAADLDAKDERYPKYLPAGFFSFAVFFRQSSEQPDRMLAPMIGAEVPGFMGAFVLGPSDDPDSLFSARIMRLQAVGSDIIDSSPSLAEEGGRVVRSGMAIVGSSEHPGDGVSLSWGENNFAVFAFDILAILRGTYEPGRVSSWHGMSVRNKDWFDKTWQK